MWGAAPLWSPALHYNAGACCAACFCCLAAAGCCGLCRQVLVLLLDLSSAACPGQPPALTALSPLLRPAPPRAPAATNRLFLFYSESRKSLSPGGDVKLIVSDDCGESWSAPRLLYSHEAEGEVPKVCASRLTVAKDGSWYLPGACGAVRRQWRWCWRRQSNMGCAGDRLA